MGLTRGLHPDTLAALVSGQFHPVLLVHVDWPDDPVFASSALVPIQWRDHTWQPAGEFGLLEIASEGLGAAIPAEASVGIVGTLELLAGLLDREDARNIDIDVYLALVTTPQGGALVGDPFPLMTGYCDGNDLGLRALKGGVEPAFTLAVKTGPGVRTVLSAQHSDEDQRQRFPEDTGFRHTKLIELALSRPPVWTT
ncbi:hypothetical protein [Salipiger marinus]|uniref:hypothetical protein n=1 Tax=Salipiger marinus TaxID=555512 RepID=UPI00405943D7